MKEKSSWFRFILELIYIYKEISSFGGETHGSCRFPLNQFCQLSLSSSSAHCMGPPFSSTETGGHGMEH